MHGHLVREKLAHCSKPCVVLGDFLDGGYWAQVFYSLLVASETTEKRLVSFGGFLAFHWITHQYVQTSLDIPPKKWSWKDGLVIAESSFTSSTAG